MYLGRLDPASNQANYSAVLEVVDDDTNDLVDLTGASITFEIRDPTTKQAVLSATTTNGKVTITDTGVFTVAFTRTEMQAVPAGTYDAGCIITIAGTTQQLIAGEIPVIDGIVQ